MPVPLTMWKLPAADGKPEIPTRFPETRAKASEKESPGPAERTMRSRSVGLHSRAGNDPPDGYRIMEQPPNTATRNFRRQARALALASGTCMVIHVAFGNFSAPPNLKSLSIDFWFYGIYMLLGLLYALYAAWYFIRSEAGCSGLLHLFFALANVVLSISVVSSYIMSAQAQSR